MSGFDATIAEIARRQHALISVPQAVAAGGTRKMLRSRVERGHLERVDVDVLRVGGAPLSWEARLLAPILSVGDGAVASHRAAAALWGLEGFGKGVPEITIPRGRRYRRAGVRCHESTDLDRCGVRQRAGIPVTDPSRTLLDLARFTSDRRLLQAAESARRLGLSSWSEMIAVLARHARQGRHGVRRLRRVITANAQREAITDNDFELLVYTLLREHSLPEPDVHHQLRGPDGRVLVELDLAYPHLRIAIELDGAVHRERDVFERDRRRQNGIVLDGWIVLRFTWRTFVERPEEIVTQVRAAIRLASAAA
jgi:very-short-patch-repair endonuclease